MKLAAHTRDFSHELAAKNICYANTSSKSIAAPDSKCALVRLSAQFTIQIRAHPKLSVNLSSKLYLPLPLNLFFLRFRLIKIRCLCITSVLTLHILVVLFGEYFYRPTYY